MPRPKRVYSQRVDTARQLDEAYRVAAMAVEEEESLERKYRLEPGPAVARAHAEAGRRFVGALARPLPNYGFESPQDAFDLAERIGSATRPA